MMRDALRVWFIALYGLGIVGFLASVIRFRPHRGTIEKKIGPIPAPIGVVLVLAVVILATGTGEISGETSVGWAILRGGGFGLSLYAIIMLPWALRSLGRLAVPGAAVLRDHELVTSGAFRVVRHPLASAQMVLWLGAALGTLNWLLLALWPLVVVGGFLTTQAEERLLREKFGTAYEEYAVDRGRFIPKPWRR